MKEIQIMNNNYYILIDEKIISASLMEWALWMETPKNRIIKQIHINEIFILTVFLGLNYNFGFCGNKTPILFETMIFNGKHSEEQWRHRSIDEAKKFHNELIIRIRANMDLPDYKE